MSELRVGHFGTNGHSVLGALKSHPRATLVGVCHIELETLAQHWGEDHPGLDSVNYFGSLDDIIAESDLIVFCSPVRHEQPRECQKALEAGRHVLAEKPCAFSQDDVDLMIMLNREGTSRFREMGGTTLSGPLVKVREMIEAGAIGEVVCVQALKSYPMHERRPKFERIDGGLLMQAGIHGVRAMQETTGLTITEVRATETQAGLDDPGELRRAACAICNFDNGAVGELTVNYCNPPEIGFWGNDQIRVFGTEGMIEMVDGKSRIRLANGDGPFQDLEPAPPGPSYLDLYIAHILDGTDMPLPLERELQSTRVVIAMKEAAESGVAVKVPVE